jgi:hypothetical protein
MQALIDSDLPSRRDVKAVFALSGFTPVVHKVVTQVTAPNWPSFFEKSAVRADSFWRGCQMTISSEVWRHSGPMGI